MGDLIMTYTIGKTTKREIYKTCFDFTDKFKNAEDANNHYKDAVDFNIVLFQNLMNTKHFRTAGEMYEHLVNIMH